ncbi:hypothetical protein UFOVP227_6 [uncultured Caudovirales phage]|uniref:Uncharacterized protein n=1 Tax=uncultured Caudovirales phage TaxID=2100421 RepID=A0A6J7WUG3_9CAUD|nr:hypothetical protein UFOVP227_6 [uncultured Caudovirales phage]
MGSTTNTRLSDRLRTLRTYGHTSKLSRQAPARAHRSRSRGSDGTPTQYRHGYKRHCLALLVCIAIFGTMSTPVKAHDGLDMSRKKYGAIMADGYYDLIAQLETGISGDNWNYSTRTYTSALGINRQTAKRWSGRVSLANMTPRQVVRIADRIAFSGWTNPTGEYVYPVGPFGWGTVRHSATLRRYLCKSTHPRVQRWRKRACNGS